MIKKELLQRLYEKEKKSAKDIADVFGCSENKVNYWLSKHNIKKRTISQSIYLKNNPHGDPFCFNAPTSHNEWFLYGLGLGLFWGEGNKMNRTAVRLGNTDPDLIIKFLQFLTTFYQIDTKRLHFGLQIFTDISKEEALAYWCEKLNSDRHQFQKIVVTKSIRKGTYKKKSKYGVITIYFSNTKLRDTIMSAIAELRSRK